MRQPGGPDQYRGDPGHRGQPQGVTAGFRGVSQACPQRQVDSAGGGPAGGPALAAGGRPPAGRAWFRVVQFPDDPDGAAQLAEEGLAGPPPPDARGERDGGDPLPGFLSSLAAFAAAGVQRAGDVPQRRGSGGRQLRQPGR
jgi:hypothetical protein